MKDTVLQLYFDFCFQGVSIVTACFLLLATVTLPDLSFPSHIRRDNKCVKRRLLNASGVVAICKEFSFQCLHNVGSCGLPKCQPVYEMRTYHVIKGNRKVAFTQRVTVNCICAKCEKQVARQLELLQEDTCTTKLSQRAIVTVSSPFVATSFQL